METVTQHEDKSESWLEWRKKGLGSSDAPIIMGVSPYKTPYQLWEEKTGKVTKDQKSNFIQQKGNRLEPVARAKYEIMTGNKMEVSLHEHKEFPFLRASMDGFNADLNFGIEIKFQGKEDHMKAHEEQYVPEKYMPQVQHQMLVTGASHMEFISYNPECTPNMAIVIVKPDEKWMLDYLVKALEFWNVNVLKDKAPELTDKDKRIITDATAVDLSKKYLAQSLIVSQAQDALDEIKVKLLEVVGSEIPRAQIGEISFSKVFKKGNVDYAKVPELKGLDLEKYRKKGSSYYKFNLPGEAKDSAGSAE